MQRSCSFTKMASSFSRSLSLRRRNAPNCSLRSPPTPTAAMSTDAPEPNVFLTQGNEAGVDLHAKQDAAAASQDLVSSGHAGVDPSLGGGIGGVSGDHISQSTRLHHKMREMKEMDDALSLMKSDYASRIRSVSEGEQRFLVKQHNIVKYLKRFKLFILESDTKRARAEKKEAEEHRQRLLKVKEIETQRAHFLALQSTRSDLKSRLDYYRQNKSYLESVKDSVPDQYGEIDELIIRYTILNQTNSDLTEHNRKVNAAMESLGAEMTNLRKRKQNEILVMNSKFAHLLQKLERVTNETATIENEVLASEARTREMARCFGEIQMAIKNIYQRTMLSLPSKKAVTQMKKRMAQQAASQQQAQAAAAAAQGGSSNAAAVAAANAAQAAADAGISQSTSRSGTAPGGSHAFDSDSDEDEGAHAAASSATGTSAAASAAASLTASADLAASVAQSAALHAKNLAVKSHLVQLLDSISERLVDLQFIVDQNYPLGVQTLREGGTLFPTGSGPTPFAMTSPNNANAGHGASGAGTDRNGVHRRATHGGESSTAESSSRRTPKPAHRQLSPSHSSRPESRTSSRAEIVPPIMQLSPSRPRLSRAEIKAEMENKFRHINAQLAGSHGLDDRNIPATQIARATSPPTTQQHSPQRGKLGLPTVKGAQGSAGASPRTASPRR